MASAGGLSVTSEHRRRCGTSAEPLAGFDPSERFVLAALAGDASAARALLADALDYERLTRFALHHEVVGELTQFLARHGLSLDHAVDAALAAFVERLTDHVARVERETVRLAGILDAEAFPAVFAKGAIAGALYRTGGTVRTAKDVDVYVARSELGKVLAALRRHYDTPDRDGGPSLRRDLSRLHHVSLWSEENEVMVEMHFGLAAPWHGLRFDLAGAIERRVPFDFARQTIMTFSPVDAVGFWSVELAKDSWVSLKKIIDFSRCVQAAASSDETLADAFRAARACGGERMLRISLILGAWLGTLECASPAVARATGDERAVAIARICLAKLARGHVRPAFSRRVREGLSFAQKHDTAAAQLGHVVRIIILYRLRTLLRRT